MSLRDYRRKRDFAQTREPRGQRARASEQAMFVVQLHHARRRHFDFRLQVGGVLKSWAVPKGPSFDPKVKRLAVEVEDHPLDYAGFEGDIPEGHYGAGHVDRFDHGRWQPDGNPSAQLKKGHLSFQLFGRRLKGHWHLVRSHRQERQPAWFLIKGDDEFAGKLEADDLLNERMKASTAKAAKKSTSKKAAAPKRAVVDKGLKPSSKRPVRPKRLDAAAWNKRAADLDGARKQSIDGKFFAPQLTRLAEKPPQGDQWLHEIKWDGYRLLTAVASGKVNLWSRNAIEWNDRVPELHAALAALGLHSVRFDGELIALDEQGRSDFGLLQKTLAGEESADLRYVLFDLLHLEGYDLSRVPLVKRKEVLEALIKAAHSDRLLYSTHAAGDGDAVFAMAVQRNLEGIISKRADGMHHAGRSDDWKKIKRLSSDEFAVVGYTAARGSRVGFGSLLLARPAADGGWNFAGRVGTGFSDSQLQSLTESLKKHPAKTPPVHKQTIDPLLRGAHWVRPRAVAEVYFRGIGNQGLLRQPSLKALRLDKLPEDLRNGDNTLRRRGDKAMAKTSATPRKRGVRGTASEAVEVAGIAITHPDREVYPGEGITKQDVADYYYAVMAHFLPNVKGRPVSVIRCPGGIAKQCFFQKHAIDGLKHTPSARLKEESGGTGDYLYPDAAEAVIELVQFGAIEFHPWGSTVDDPDRATSMIFDLDPGPEVSWPDVVRGARCVRDLLSKVGLTSFVRVTGGKGLHVVVPLKPACDWETVRHVARSFAQTVARTYPDRFIAVASKNKRQGLIFIDYLRNGRGATAVASYSLRARPGAPVAVPLRWDELGKLKGAASFDIRTVPKRLTRQRSDPWDGFTKLRQDLSKLSLPEDDE
ncbi:MAG TPA: DNA ligase D [Dyella sp.]|uniref:DNA ligase D n=1 Tax=Dyella sp. TaxID=1869338 RepID=UPI002F92251A